jgi:hypothetical protein
MASTFAMGQRWSSVCHISRISFLQKAAAYVVLAKVTVLDLPCLPLYTSLGGANLDDAPILLSCP